MGEPPYFPPPRAKPDGGAYREAAPRPLGEPVAQPKRVVVSRPDAPLSQPQPKVPARELLAPMADERTYWERHTTFARFPRPLGGVLALLGGWIAWESVHTLFHGGMYGVRSTLFGPVALLAGGWALLFGYPLQGNGRPPSWWALGQVTCVVVGLCIGAALLGLLASSAAY